MPSANTLVRWVNEYAFASIVQARPCPTFGRPVHLRGGPHRLRPGTSPHALRIPPHDGHPALRNYSERWLQVRLGCIRLSPSCPFRPLHTCPALSGQRGITPAFGYDTPHLSIRGTLTLPNNALLSAHCEALRLPAAPPALLRFLRRAVPPLRLALRSRGHKAQHPRARGLFTGFPTTGFFDGDDRTSQVPGGPSMNVPLLSDPVGPPRSATTALRCCLPPIGRRRLPRKY